MLLGLEPALTVSACHLAYPSMVLLRPLLFSVAEMEPEFPVQLQPWQPQAIQRHRMLSEGQDLPSVSTLKTYHSRRH